MDGVKVECVMPTLQCELDHDNEVCCVALSSLATEVASGTVDGLLFLVRTCTG